MRDELKTCPFCGGEAEVHRYQYQGTGASGMETPEPFIRCQKCGAKQPRVQCDNSPWGRKNNKKTYAQAEAEAIAAWNTRTIQADRAELVAEIVAWLREEANGWMCADMASSEIEDKWGKK